MYNVKLMSLRLRHADECKDIKIWAVDAYNVLRQQMKEETLLPRRNEIHDLMNIHEQFMNIHELFMNGNHIWFMN